MPKGLENMIIIRDGVAHANKCDPWCYFANVNSIDYVLHIATKMLQVDVPPVIIFYVEQQQIDAPNPPKANDDEQFCCAGGSVEANIATWGTTAEEIAELQLQGTKVDDNNKPAQENIATTCNMTN